MTHPDSHRRGRAVVVGASAAGLLAARVLADRFDQVVVLERDSLNLEAPEIRRGVPQAHHQHVLTARGRGLIEEFFPGFDARLAAMGAPVADYTGDFILRLPFGRVPRFRSGVELRLCRRACIDHALLKGLVAHSNVELRDHVQVTGFVHERGRVRGVRIGSEDTVLHADWVVDATGRGSRTSRWLSAWGYEPPREQVVDPHVGYATRLYRKPSGFEVDFRAVEIAAVPGKNPRAAGLWQVEDGTLLLTLIGTAKQHPPTDEAGYDAFARALPDPIVFDTIRQCEPISPIRAYRRGENRWRHYETLARFPDGLIVLGDSFAHFNPLYGHGITSAALQAEAFGRALTAWHRRGRPAGKLHKAFYRRATPYMHWFWLLNTLEDLRWPTTTGREQGALVEVFHRYVDLLLPLTPHEPEVVRALVRVANLLDGPTALANPRLLTRVVAGHLRMRIARNSTPAPPPPTAQEQATPRGTLTHERGGLEPQSARLSPSPTRST